MWRSLIKLNRTQPPEMIPWSRFMKALNDPNVVKFIWRDRDWEILYLPIEDTSGGEVFESLVLQAVAKKDIWTKCHELTSTVQFCHQKLIVHRDLTAENLFLDAAMNIKIADFVFSKIFTFGNKLNTFHGNLPMLPQSSSRVKSRMYPGKYMLLESYHIYTD